MEASLSSSDSYSIQANSWSLTNCVKAIATVKIVQVPSSNNAIIPKAGTEHSSGALSISPELPARVSGCCWCRCPRAMGNWMFSAVTRTHDDLPMLLLTVHLKMVSGQNPRVVLQGSCSVKKKFGFQEQTCVGKALEKKTCRYKWERKAKLHVFPHRSWYYLGVTEVGFLVCGFSGTCAVCHSNLIWQIDF